MRAILEGRAEWPSRYRVCCDALENLDTTTYAVPTARDAMQVMIEHLDHHPKLTTALINELLAHVNIPALYVSTPVRDRLLSVLNAAADALNGMQDDVRIVSNRYLGTQRVKGWVAVDRDFADEAERDPLLWLSLRLPGRRE